MRKGKRNNGKSQNALKLGAGSTKLTFLVTRLAIYAYVYRTYILSPRFLTGNRAASNYLEICVCVCVCVHSSNTNEIMIIWNVTPCGLISVKVWVEKNCLHLHGRIPRRFISQQSTNRPWELQISYKWFGVQNLEENWFWNYTSFRWQSALQPSASKTPKVKTLFFQLFCVGRHHDVCEITT